MYSAANYPETAYDPRPQMIPKLDRKWSKNYKWSPGWIVNDPAKKFEMGGVSVKGENIGRWR